MKVKVFAALAAVIAIASITTSVRPKLTPAKPVVKAEPASARTFQVNGRVRKVDLTEKIVTVAHEEIPGYMPAMTMPLTVKNVVLLAGLQAGDEIHFELSVTDDDSWISALEKIGAPDVSTAALASLAGDKPETQPDDATDQGDQRDVLHLA